MYLFFFKNPLKKKEDILEVRNVLYTAIGTHGQSVMCCKAPKL